MSLVTDPTMKNQLWVGINSVNACSEYRPKRTISDLGRYDYCIMLSFLPDYYRPKSKNDHLGRYCSNSLMVFLAFGDLESAVELFGQNKSCHKMGERYVSEAYPSVSTRTDFGRNAVAAPYDDL